MELPTSGNLGSPVRNSASTSSDLLTEGPPSDASSLPSQTTHLGVENGSGFLKRCSGALLCLEGEFNSDDHYIFYCGQESLRRNGVAIMVKKESEMQYLDAISKTTE